MLVGRDSERAAIAELLDAARESRSGVLVLRGEPGIGKTALLEDAREQAADMHVLGARGVESESELPLAALDQLLRPAFGHLDDLPQPQAAALRGAFGLDDSLTDRRFLVFTACLSLLSELAEERPVLCVVDDAHWLDSASTEALLFVARRLDAEGVVLLFGARDGDVRRFDAPDLPSLVLEGLDDTAAAELLGRGAGSAAPSVREWLFVQTRGNALALVELPKGLTDAQLAGDEPLPEALPLTRRVEEVFLGRVRRLPEPTQRLLLIAAADDAEDPTLVLRAGERLGADPRMLDPAEHAGLVSVRHGRLEFRHPLVRSAIYEAATAGERRDAHRALADALEHELDAPDRRAWHLAASVVGADDDVAAALEQAAVRAAERAGFLASARALERAAELSSNGADRGRRLVLAAHAASLAGDDELAVALARKAEPLVDDPRERGEIACALGAAAVRSGRPLDGVPGLVTAARELAGLDPKLAVEALVWANAAAFSTANNQALRDMADASEAVVAAGVAGDLAHVLTALQVFPLVVEGRPVDTVELAPAFAWAVTAEDPELVFVVSMAAYHSGNRTTGDELLDRSIAVARRRGELGILVEALASRAMRHAAAQRFADAVQEATEGSALARELGYSNVAARAASVLAFVAAIRGDEEDAHRHAHDLLELATAHGITPRVDAVTYGLALLDLAQRRWEDALERLVPLVDRDREGGDPLLARHALADVVEASVRTGRHDEARQALAAFEDWAAHSGPSWPGPVVASCRALLADGAEASEHFEDALAQLAVARPLDAARIRLLYGEHLRRERRRTDARIELRAAIAEFERLRAQPWVDRAVAELRATGETARKRDPSTIDQLTAQELQIVRFVAEGMSNKDVAAQLFLSPRTIDYHLRKVFAKLGITSRTQLARLQLADEPRLAGAGASSSA